MIPARREANNVTRNIGQASIIELAVRSVNNFATFEPLRLKTTTPGTFIMGTNLAYPVSPKGLAMVTGNEISGSVVWLLSLGINSVVSPFIFPLQ